MASNQNGWTRFLVAVGASAAGFVLFRGTRPRATLKSEPAKLRSVPKPVAFSKPGTVYAYIYQRRSEPEFRMAIGPAFARAQEMGIFSTVEAAQAVALQKGWKLAWKGYRDA